MEAADEMSAVVTSEQDIVVTYLDVLRTMWPIALVGVTVSFCMGFRRIYREDTWRKRVAVMLVTCVPAAAAAVTGVLVMPLVFPDTVITPDLQVGIAGILGGWGTKIFDALMRKAFGFSIKEEK